MAAPMTSAGRLARLTLGFSRLGGQRRGDSRRLALSRSRRPRRDCARSGGRALRRGRTGRGGLLAPQPRARMPRSTTRLATPPCAWTTQESTSSASSRAACFAVAAAFDFAARAASASTPRRTSASARTRSMLVDASAAAGFAVAAAGFAVAGRLRGLVAASAGLRRRPSPNSTPAGCRLGAPERAWTTRRRLRAADVDPCDSDTPVSVPSAASSS